METWILTLLMILGTIVGVIVYDIWALRRGGIPATISMVVLGCWRRYPHVLLALGFLLGHLLWPQHVDSAPVDCVRCAVECKR